MGLTEKQKTFCREYLIDFNATRAAIRAGYSERSAKSIGHENLTKHDIQTYLAELQRPVLEKFNVEHERILWEYALIAFANIGNFLACDSDGFIKTVNGLPYSDFNDVHLDHLAGVECFEVVHLPSVHGNPMHAGFKVKIKLGNKIHALDMLAQRAGLFREPENRPMLNASDQDLQNLARRIAFMLRKAVEDKKKTGDD